MDPCGRDHDDGHHIQVVGNGLIGNGLILGSLILLASTVNTIVEAEATNKKAKKIDSPTARLES